MGETRFKNTIVFEGDVTVQGALNADGLPTFDATSLTINDNAAAGTNEDPALILKGGDGGSEIIRSDIKQDSSADLLYIQMGGGAAGATRKSPTLVLGVPGETTASIDATLRFEGASDGGVNRTATITHAAEEQTLTITSPNVVISGSGSLTVPTGGLAEASAGAGVTIDGVSLKDGAINENQFVEVHAITAAGGAGGATAGTLDVDVRRYGGEAVDAAVTLLIVATNAAYAGPWDQNSNVTFNTASTGTLVASGSGWALIQTDATGNFACATANSNDETVYFAGCTAVGVDTLANGAIVVRSVSDDAVWAA